MYFQKPERKSEKPGKILKTPEEILLKISDHPQQYWSFVFDRANIILVCLQIKYKNFVIRT